MSWISPNLGRKPVRLAKKIPIHVQARDWILENLSNLSEKLAVHMPALRTHEETKACLKGLAESLREDTVSVSSGCIQIKICTEQTKPVFGWVEVSYVKIVESKELWQA